MKTIKHYIRDFFSLFCNAESNVVAANRILIFFILVYGLSTYSGFYYLAKRIKDQTTIIIPYTSPDDISEAMEVSAEYANEKYLYKMALVIMNLRHSFTKETAKTNFEHLQDLYSPNAYGGYENIRNSYIELLDIIERENIASSMLWSGNVVHKRKDKELEITTGIKRSNKHTPDDKVHFVQEKHFIQYEIVNGRFGILRLEDESLRRKRLHNEPTSQKNND